MEGTQLLSGLALAQVLAFMVGSLLSQRGQVSPDPRPGALLGAVTADCEEDSRQQCAGRPPVAGGLGSALLG